MQYYVDIALAILIFIWGLVDYIYLEVPNYLIFSGYILFLFNPSWINLILGLFVFAVFYIGFKKEYVGGADVKAVPLLPLIWGFNGYLIILISLVITFFVKVFNGNKNIPYLTVLLFSHIVYLFFAILGG